MTTDNFCVYLKNRLIQNSQTGGQRYSDTSPLVFPALAYYTTVTITAVKSFLVEASGWKRMALPNTLAKEFGEDTA
jgi:hypothetical protein